MSERERWRSVSVREREGGWREGGGRGRELVDK